MTVLRKAAMATQTVSANRPRVGGKFLFAGDEKLWIRGVTYGTFRPGPDGSQFDAEVVRRDFAAMAANGFNAVRLYTIPPRWLLDTAARSGLRVMIGLPWAQHVALIEDRKQARSALDRMMEAVQPLAVHPAVLCFSIDNEVAASVVRWFGAGRIEKWLETICHRIKSINESVLVTYANYPTTEYLQLPFLDLVCFNVYLEQRDRFDAYLSRLQNLAEDRPLLLTEIGLDSRRNGLERQAATVDWQIRASFAGGCAGAFVYAWTDEWHAGGTDMDVWDFGLTTRDRRSKPALQTVAEAFSAPTFPDATAWPSVSVVVCSYNGARTIAGCLDGLSKLDYPTYEVIIVDDGSVDATAAIASEYAVQVIRTPNQGLSAARNTGMEAATGDIIAYIDDDARPDPHWLRYLTWEFLQSDRAGIGGPNIAPAGDGAIAACVANAPGGPVHVLLTDEIAEHIPGCNMAFWKHRLLEIGGFDPRFRAAGDDVDLCWRMQDRGWTIGFSASAMVWHHRRNSLKAYWKQQVGYGKAEALLETKWPQRYNALGHVGWTGRLYGSGWTRAIGSRRGRIYQGTWGQAPFQSLYQRDAGLVASLPLMPEWWLAVMALAIVSLLGFAWAPLFSTLPFLGLAIGAPIAQAWISSGNARFPDARSRLERLKLRSLTAALHLVQPVARLCGRLQHGLSPWRRRGWQGWASPFPKTYNIWSEIWEPPEHWLGAIERSVESIGGAVRRGGDFEHWDLEVRGGLFGSGRLLHALEAYGGGRQMVRFRVWPRWSGLGVVVLITLALLAIVAGLEGAVVVSAILGGAAVLGTSWALLQAGAAMNALQREFAAFVAKPADSSQLLRIPTTVEKDVGHDDDS